MSTSGLLVVLCLVAAAAAVAWPMRSRRARQRAVLGARSTTPRAAARDAGRFNRPPMGGHTTGSRRASGAAAAEVPLEGGRHTPAPNTDSSRHLASGPRPYGRPPGLGRRPGPPGRRDPRRPAGLLDRPWPPPPERKSPLETAAVEKGVPRIARAGWLRPTVWSALSPRRALLLAGLMGAGAGGLLAGPVAAVVMGAYGAYAARAVVRRRLTRQAEAARRRSLDQLCALAADLRAGVPVLTAAAGLGIGATGIPGVGSDAPHGIGSAAAHGTSSVAPHGIIGSAAVIGGSATAAGPIAAPVATSGDLLTGGPIGAVTEPDRLHQLARAAVRLADRTGAPLADLVERIEADARATDRGLAAAAAQAAGARATAWLLAVLPLGGIGLGYGVGVDPVAVLLHTPVGAACAVTAVVLQLTGLLWAERLGSSSGGSR